jgi:hypothetical protein
MRQTVVVSLPDHDVSVLVAPVSACVTLETNEVAVLAGGRAIEVKMPVGEATVLGESPPIDVGIADGTITVVCDDIISPTFTTPTLTSWAADSEDLGPDWVHVHFSAVTDGSPCRVKFKLVHSGSPDLRSGFSSPEQLTPHLCMIGSLVPGSYIDDSDRGLDYDLYWSWTSGMSVGAYALVASGAVYIPATGEGDFPQSG